MKKEINAHGVLFALLLGKMMYSIMINFYRVYFITVTSSYGKI